MTLLKMFGDLHNVTPEERNVRFCVKEHRMGAISNGIALHNSGLIPYCATFFVFTDYMRAAMRISTLCEEPIETYMQSRRLMWKFKSYIMNLELSTYWHICQAT